VPGSGWQDIEVIADNAKIVAVAAAALGLLFGCLELVLRVRTGLSQTLARSPSASVRPMESSFAAQIRTY
jgi:hypothetical protein